MLIDAMATGLIAFPLSLSRNPVVVYIDPLDPTTYPDRADLRYLVELYIQQYYQAGTYQLFNTLEGAERPPAAFSAYSTYQAADFDLSYMLDDVLSRKLPDFNQAKIQVCDGLTRSYYPKYIRKSDGTTVDQFTFPASYVIKAGIDGKDFEMHGRRFFYDRIGKFLTWSVNSKKVRLDQPEFLYFLTNFSPQPTQLKLKVRLLTTDGVETVRIVDTVSNVAPYTVYNLPVGPANPTIAAFLTDSVLQYDVWVSNQADQRLSEIRTFILDRRYIRNVRHLLFSNSLGGFDTITCVGRSTETIKVSQLISERYDNYQLDASYAERIINDVTGERELSIHSGPLTREIADYLTELILAEEIYLVSDRDYLPLIRTSEAFSARVDDETLVSRQFAFRYANKQKSYSRLPVINALPNRPTGWRSIALACELNANGLRTGKRIVSLLERYHLDDNSATIPREIKPNLENEDGYIAPVVAAECAVTPYTNAAIDRLGTFRKSNCATSQVGSYASIIVAAGTYGSELSQTDANAKAEAAYQAMNTQAYADAYGSCSAAPFLNQVYTKAISYYKSSCGSGKIGTNPIVTIPAGVYGSAISQADANAKAAAAWEAYNTQAYADANGLCVDATQTVIDVGGSLYVLLTRNSDNTYTMRVKSRYVSSVGNLVWNAGAIAINEPLSPFVTEYVYNYPASMRGQVIPASTVTYYENTGGVYAASLNFSSFTFF